MAITTVLSNLHIPQRLRSLSKSSDQVRTELEKLKKEADKTHRSLIFRSHGGTPLTQLVHFYQLVSPWCDRSAKLYQLERALASIDYGQYEKARKALLALATQEERSIHGVNQTSPGKIPSMDTTLLGGHRCCGLFTQTVSYWESNRDEYENKLALIGQSDSPTIMAVIDERALELLSDGIKKWYKLLFDLIYS